MIRPCPISRLIRDRSVRCTSRPENEHNTVQLSPVSRRKSLVVVAVHVAVLYAEGSRNVRRLL